MTEKLDISVVIPVLNEETTIVGTLEELIGWFSTEMPSETYEIIIVDDGSTDKTAATVSTFSAAHPQVRIVQHGWNIGRGRGVRTGFAHSRGNFVITMDADLSYAPHHIRDLLEPLRAGEADITLASAYHPDGKVINVPYRRLIVSQLGNLVLRLGTFGEIHTVTCLVRGYTREVVETLQLTSDGKELHLEVVQKAPLFGFRIREVPATLEWRDRKRKARSTGKKRKVRFLPSKGSTVVSHLSYSFLLRPALLVMTPVLVLVGILCLGAAILLINIISRFISAEKASIPDALYTSLHDTLIDGGLTLLIMLFSGILLFLFISFAAMTAQSKKSYEEMIVLFSRVQRQLDNLEKDKIG